MNFRPRPWALAVALFLGLTPASLAQDELTIRVDPPMLELKVGETAQLEVLVTNEVGEVQDIEVVIFSRSRGAVRVDDEGKVEAFKPGVYTMVARTARSSGARASVEIPVEISYAAIAAVEFVDAPEQMYVGTSTPLEVRITDEVGFLRKDMIPRIASLQPSIASIDEFGNVVAVEAGTCTIEASTEAFKESLRIEVLANPVNSIELAVDDKRVRTGDVIQLVTTLRGADGQALTGPPVTYSCLAKPDDDLGPAATGQIEQDGRFVANKPGYYTLVATCGTVSAQTTVRAEPRKAARKVKLIGRGKVQDVHSSDLWIWEGVDGLDYAVTGTWGANGEARFWDVTDPANIQQISAVTVDARTVNDVKVSPDGALCILSREGASNRKNGIVIIDVLNPREPEVIATYTDQLTGGVHNLFIYDEHVFALSAGRRYDIISIEDPYNPVRVGTFELDTPGHSIHDVWVVDGIAYSSNWGDGVYMVDVGNGVAGGSVENPVIIGSYAYPSGWNHAAFPYHDEETGKFYIVAGDEAFPYGLSVEDHPTYPRGYFHFIDFTDPLNPKEVARYEVPEAGSHNLWVEDDVLYVAYYNGGFRAVDISGDLMGNLYDQGREIASFLSADHEGYVSNAPMVWGPQPHKGRVFFTDWNSGLWSVEIEPPQGE